MLKKKEAIKEAIKEYLEGGFYIAVYPFPYGGYFIGTTPENRTQENECVFDASTDKWFRDATRKKSGLLTSKKRGNMTLDDLMITLQQQAGLAAYRKQQVQLAEYEENRDSEDSEDMDDFLRFYNFWQFEEGLFNDSSSLCLT